jgi:hypothetical protein
MSFRAALLAFAMTASCAAPAPAPSVRELAPQGTEKYTVVLFFSADCHVLRAHDARIRQLAVDYAGRGVRFVALDPEVGATGARDREEASRRGYPFPIVVDKGAKMAKAFGAEYAGHAVVLDRDGAVVFRGGIDSDRVRLTDDRIPYLGNALADLVAGRAPRVAEAKVLGCALRTW